MTWREAFRQQALSDYAVFRHLTTQADIPICHRLHYLQMATEKLAKSLLLVGSNAPNERSHYALVPFLRMLPGRPDIRARLKWADNPQQFKTYIDRKIIPWAEKIQNLVPVGGSDRLNPEYPWLNGSGEVACPATYGFPEFSKVELIRFATFIDNLIRVTG
jgi:hypothetical protein